MIASRGVYVGGPQEGNSRLTLCVYRQRQGGGRIAWFCMYMVLGSTRQLRAVPVSAAVEVATPGTSNQAPRRRHRQARKYARSADKSTPSSPNVLACV